MSFLSFASESRWNDNPKKTLKPTVWCFKTTNFQLKSTCLYDQASIFIFEPGVNTFKREGCHFLVNSSSKKRRRATLRQIVVSHVVSTNGVLRPNVSVSCCEFFFGGSLASSKNAATCGVRRLFGTVFTGAYPTTFFCEKLSSLAFSNTVR